MPKRILSLYFVFLLTTTTIVVSQDNNDVALIADGIEPKSNVTCYCINDDLCDTKTNTCTLKQPHDTCYESWTFQKHYNSIHLTAGCMYNDYFFIRLMCDTNTTDRYVICCSQRDYCNDLDAYSKDIRQALLHISSNEAPITPIKPGNSYKIWIIVFVLISIFLIVMVFVSLLFYLKRKRSTEKPSKFSKDYIYSDEQPKKGAWQRIRRYMNFCGCYKSDMGENIPSDQSLTGLLVELSTSTSGPALPILMQRTLARQITLREPIGAGRYGSVHLGKWREDDVAVKIFSANEERSWFREIDIYQTVCLRHENILGFIAADNKDASTHTQLWLVTEYHENGSVYDYLRTHTITLPILVKMMLSIASGLCHLHMPIDSTNGKVALAHRDLKTKNILVKKDLTCCIADLGLAVKEVRNIPKLRRDGGKEPEQEKVVIDIQANSRAGTLRYMAPEVLDGTLNMQSFESFKAADIYALGLAYWEMFRRCQLNPNEMDADSPQVPYEDLVPNNPTLEEMRNVVCTRKMRPPISPRWKSHSVFQQLTRLCEELWIEDPSCRLNSLNIKKNLKKQMELIESDLANINTNSQQQATQNDGPWTA